MKLLITIVFKAHNQRIILGQSWPGHNIHSSKTHGLFEKLGLSLSDEKDSLQNHMKVFIKKLHSFELQNIYQGGYVQFIHFISQIVMHTSTPVDNKSERNHLLPPKSLLVSIMRSFCKSLRAEEINLAVISQETKPKKLLLYKFFFFNYMFQVSGEDVLDHLTKMSTDENKKQSNQDKLDALSELLQCFMMILNTLRSRKMNVEFDNAIKPPSKWLMHIDGVNKTQMVRESVIVTSQGSSVPFGTKKDEKPSKD